MSDLFSKLTRRELLVRGALQFSAVSLLPSLYGALTREAFGAAAPDWIPAMVIDLDGGAALCSHFLVGGKGGPTDFLTSYDKLGWDPRGNNALEEAYGLPIAREGSFLAGLTQTASEAARRQFRMGSYCHESDSDTNSNPLSAFHLFSRAGAHGTVVKRGVGTTNSKSGGKSRGVAEDPAYTATFIRNISDLEGLNRLEGILGVVTPSLRGRIVDRLAKLSAEQAAQFASSEDGKKVRDSLSRADREMADSMSKIVNLDPRRDAGAAAVFGLNANTDPQSPAAVFAGLALAVLNRHSGPAVLTLGGYDYHQGNLQEIARKDQAVGQLVGRLIELAHRMKKPLFLQLITDGGCSPDPKQKGQRVWTSDSNVACMTVNAFYHPTAPAQNVRLQIGHFNDGQGADRDTYVGRSQERVAALSFANYLALSGRLGEVENFVPPGLIDTALLRDPKHDGYPLLWG